MAELPAEAVVGVDVGGTFTDVVHWDGVELTTLKLPTTADQSVAAMQGTAELTRSSGTGLLHGTTVATNTLLERKGAATAFITTEGFGDVIEIGRQDRPALYDPFASRAVPLASAAFRLEVGRGGPQGLDLEAINGAEAVAISLLYGYLDTAAELEIAALVREALPEALVSLSSTVAPEFREFERASTTVLNAYLAPATTTYLRSFAAAAAASGLFEELAVMRSSGGLMSLDAAARLPAAILLSGPAGGVVAAAEIGATLGKERIVSLDMGGTSTDVCRVEHGRPEVVYGRAVAGYPCLMPSVAIHTVGAGGGSIAWVDSGGSLRVGPMSAGARPGPAGYGRGGTEATVTDANIVLGRIDPDASLAGRLPVEAQLSSAAVGAVGERAGLGPVAAAKGIVEVIEEVMAGALRKVSVEEGADPRAAWLVAFGGAGGLHAGSLARRLDMAGVVVPPYAGVLSALGLLMSPPRVDASQTVMLVDVDEVALEDAVAAVCRSAATELAAMSRLDAAGTVSSVVDVRYAGQSHELSVPYGPGDGWSVLVQRFNQLHHERNGFARPEDPVEAITVRAEAVGAPQLTVDQLPPFTPQGEAIAGAREVVTSGGATTATVYRRLGLRPGDEVAGPAVIEEDEATTYVDERELVRVLDSGALEVTW